MSAAQRQRYLHESTLKANGRILAEWNLNRFSGGPVVQNHLLATQVEDIYYDIESVALPDRPTRGIVKAMVQGDAFSGAGKVSSAAADLSRNSTAYVVSEEDQYKYWISPSRSALSISAPSTYDIANAGIEITYPISMYCNKIAITFETTISTPKSVTLSLRTGVAWSSPFTITSPVVDDKGMMTLWKQSDGTWSQSVNLSTNYTQVTGIRLVINSLTTGDNHAAVIELSPRLVYDATDYLVDAEVQHQMSDHSKIAPFGVSSSNVGGVTLDNSDRMFSTNTTVVPFVKMIGRGVEMSLLVNPTKENELPNQEDYIPLFTSMSATAVDESDESVVFELKDGSRVLQERNPPSMLLENCSVTEAVLRICHSVGFNDINYDMSDIDARDRYATVPYFWTDSERTAWENISTLAEASQTAVYFDEHGQVKVQTRREAFNLSNPVVWGIDADDVTGGHVSAKARPADETGKKSDLVSLDNEDQEVPNTVDVTYFDTKPSKMTRGIPEFTVAWSPEGDVVLRAARVRGTISPTAPSAGFAAEDVVTWPFSGMFQVNGEVMSYDAKRYRYYNSLSGSGATHGWVTSLEEQQKFDAISPGRAWQNKYTGEIRLKDRGLFSTVKSYHWYGGTSYLVRRRLGTGSFYNYDGLVVNAQNGYASISTGSSRLDAFVVAKKTSGYLPRIVGTRITFPSGGPAFAAAGVTIGCGTNDSGIYIELVKTSGVGDRQSHNELNLYWKSEGGVVKRYGPEGGKGVPIIVADSVGYDIDVHYGTQYGSPGVPAGPNHYVSVYVNGENKMTVQIPRSQTISVLPSEQGFFVRGPGGANFEHFYHVGETTKLKNPIDAPGAYDIVTGASRSMVFTSSAAWTPYTSRFTEPWDSTGALAQSAHDYGTALFMDEFGMIAHEVREFDVKFDDGIMLHSQLYCSNDTQAACPAFRANAFGAKFIMVNTARHNAVLNGEDTITYGPESTVNHRLMVYGRKLNSEESESVTEVNKFRAVRDGKIELQISNEFIQTKGHAETLANWVVNDSGGDETASVEAFANPHIQLGDVVAVTYLNKGIDYNKFFVVEKSLRYDGGLGLDLVLRSVV